MMHKTIILTIFFVTSTMVDCQTTKHAHGIGEPHPEPYVHPLLTLKDNTRAVLVFALSSSDRRFQRQLHAFDNHGREMADRNLIVIPVLETWRPSDSDLRNSSIPFTNEREQDYARRRFHIDAKGFVVLLIGKDGGEKFRSHNPTTIEKLTELIDAMPMRQQESKSHAQQR